MDTEKFQGKYRIPSARLASWDYGSNAAYFVTLCAHDRANVFGKIIGGRIDLTPLGQAATDCWCAIPDHFPFVVLDAFVVMPNHMHGIVIIDKPAVETQNSVETQDFASLPNRFGP